MWRGRRKSSQALGLAEAPRTLDAYVAFVDRVLDRWKQEGAVAIKFGDAYLRTLEFAAEPAESAARLFEKGLTEALSFGEYVRLQNHLARHLFGRSGELGLAVHIHSSTGGPPFLRLSEADVRNLEVVLADPAFFGTQFVLIHGGHPLTEEAAYLALKPHVWVDVSALPHILPIPELAQALRTYVLYAPERTLFGTDAPPSPVGLAGADVTQVVLSAKLREALSVALASLVRDGVLDLDSAVTFGRGVLYDNAARLYGWSGPPPAVAR